eukprot:TRINITY_DN32948_c0_g1_i1.p1 TRINITY_DN32948_c0_g1~~TRINITY_DN32948_c0_g1_i1.p1  ORF type:complete len:449 (-),score=71.65 TRINITY_DN32948_c0_g1_i1:26-1372(-)
MAMRRLSKLVRKGSSFASKAGCPGGEALAVSTLQPMNMLPSVFPPAPKPVSLHSISLSSGSPDETSNTLTLAALSDSSSTPEITARSDVRKLHYIVEPPEFPRILPHGYGVSSQHIPAMEADPIFDPAVHLQIEPPDSVISGDFVEIPFPLHEDLKDDFSLAFSKPFRLLSDEGVSALHSVIKANEHFAKSNERIPRCLRGLGYRSKFVRDLNQDPQAVELFSAMAGKPLAPHGMPMNMSHVNLGRPVVKGEKPVIVDQWHVDSVDYVCVIIMSDISQSVGGDLQVLCKPGVRDNLDFLSKGVTPCLEHLVRTIQYPGRGYALFIRGSQVLHRVTPVLEALEPRVSVVNSYMSCNVFDADSTRYRTFEHQDPTHVSNVEFSRHTAWRVQGMMKYIMDEVKWGTSKEELASLMRRAAADLEKAAALVNQDKDDLLAWVKEEGVDEQIHR